LIRFAADEDLDNHIIRGLRHRLAHIDVVRVQDAALRGAADESVLAWAARADRILLSHDASTMTVAAYARLARGDAMPGVIVVPQWLSLGAAIDDLVLIAECSEPADWRGGVHFLPLSPVPS
jgi:hypothetical protein